MPQVAIASTQSRIGDRHNRVTLYVEHDIPAYHVTDAELAELCRLAQEQTVSVADDKLIDIIDNIGDRGKVFM